MVETVLDFLKIHRKVIFGNPPVIVQYVLSKAPKTLDTVNVIFSFFIHHMF